MDLQRVAYTLPLIRSGNDHGDESLRTESVILSLYVGYSLKEWDIFSCENILNGRNIP